MTNELTGVAWLRAMAEDYVEDGEFHRELTWAADEIVRLNLKCSALAYLQYGDPDREPPAVMTNHQCTMLPVVPNNGIVAQTPSGYFCPWCEIARLAQERSDLIREQCRLHELLAKQVEPTPPQTSDEIEALCIRLKSGEYDGADIMKAWIALRALNRP